MAKQTSGGQVNQKMVGQGTRPVDTVCTGACVEIARAAFEAANGQLLQSHSVNSTDITKRFQLINDVAATDRHKESEILLEHAIAIHELLCGQHHPTVARIMLALAGVYTMHGSIESADYLKKWASEILDNPQEVPPHEFFNLFGMNSPDQDQTRQPQLPSP